tara:strand:- start:13793 stop:14101 length:309 start_codon:yes stop_codon:yes gene_type:complete
MSADADIIIEYRKICLIVYLLPEILGIIGILAFSYSLDVKIANAQKCGGVQKNIIKKRRIGSIVRGALVESQPIIGGNAPAAPPMTIFCVVLLFNQIVYTTA